MNLWHHKICYACFCFYHRRRHEVWEREKGCQLLLNADMHTKLCMSFRNVDSVAKRCHALTSSTMCKLLSLQERTFLNIACKTFLHCRLFSLLSFWKAAWFLQQEINASQIQCDVLLFIYDVPLFISNVFDTWPTAESVKITVMTYC